MPNKALDEKIAALESLRASAAPPEAEGRVREALKDRNNYLVSKAAALAGDCGLTALAPDLLAAFDRFMNHAAKSDPQCWAKNAIVKALKDLGHDDAAVFLRGITHIQMEPVWGGQEDTAPTLRGACALALIDCSLDRDSILTHLVDRLADASKRVRVDAARAIAQLPGHDSVLLLRLKVYAGDQDEEVTGQCFSALLALSARDSIPFVARYLAVKDGYIRFEAIAALGECPELAAVETLIQCWRAQKDYETKRAIVLSLGVSRLPEAKEFLRSKEVVGSG